MSVRTRWQLTPEGFDKLLDSLGPDRQAASREYESLRRWLIGLLTWTGGHDPESLADIVLDRLAKRLSEGEEIANLKAWVRVAARRVLQESYASARKEQAGAYDALRFSESPATSASDDACLQECIRQLSPANRTLLERYYGSDGNKLIPARKQLAMELGISIETLRTRALRLRKELEQRMLENRNSRQRLT